MPATQAIHSVFHQVHFSKTKMEIIYLKSNHVIHKFKPCLDSIYTLVLRAFLRMGRKKEKRKLFQF